MGNPLLRPVEPHLVALVILVPRPVVLAAGHQRVGGLDRRVNVDARFARWRRFHEVLDQVPAAVVEVVRRHREAEWLLRR